MTIDSSTNDIEGSKALKLKLPAPMAHSAPAIPVTKPEMPSAVNRARTGGRPCDDARAGLSREATMARPTELCRTERSERTRQREDRRGHRVQPADGRDAHPEQVRVVEADDGGGVVGEHALAEQPAAGGERERERDDPHEQAAGPHRHRSHQHARHRRGHARRRAA